MQDERLEALLSDFKSIADERLVHIVMTPELKASVIEKCMAANTNDAVKPARRSAAANGGGKVRRFAPRAGLATAAVAAALAVVGAAGGFDAFLNPDSGSRYQEPRSSVVEAPEDVLLSETDAAAKTEAPEARETAPAEHTSAPHDERPGNEPGETAELPAAPKAEDEPVAPSEESAGESYEREDEREREESSADDERDEQQSEYEPPEEGPAPPDELDESTSVSVYSEAQSVEEEIPVEEDSEKDSHRPMQLIPIDRPTEAGAHEEAAEAQAEEAEAQTDAGQQEAAVSDEAQSEETVPAPMFMAMSPQPASPSPTPDAGAKTAGDSDIENAELFAVGTVGGEAQMTAVNIADGRVLSWDEARAEIKAAAAESDAQSTAGEAGGASSSPERRSVRGGFIEDGWFFTCVITVDVKEVYWGDESAEGKSVKIGVSEAGGYAAGDQVTLLLGNGPSEAGANIDYTILKAPSDEMSVLTLMEKLTQQDARKSEQSEGQ